MESEFNVVEAAAELTAESGTSEASTSSEMSESHGQAETESATSGETSHELAPEDIIKKLSEEAPAEDSELLAKINSFGLIHKGAPIEIKDQKQLSELIQKGFDYTQKTMALAEESKLKQEEFAKLEETHRQKESVLQQKEQEIGNHIFENKIMETILTKMKSSDPELFDHLAQLYNQEINAYELRRPEITRYESQFQQLHDEIAQLKGVREKEDLGKIKASWESELSEVQSKTAPALAKLGVKVDWDKVKSVWTSDASNKMTVEQALYASHGKEIAKANESYAKLMATKAKTNEKLVNRSGVGAQTRGQESFKVKPGSYEELLKMASSNI